MNSNQHGRVISEMAQSLGHTVESEAQTAVSGGKIAYVSGAIVVLYDIQQDQQIKWVCHRTYLISAIALSSTGHHLSVAESIKDAYIYVYNLQTQDKCINIPIKTIAVKRGSISHLIYSPNNAYLVGISNDENLLTVWEDDTVVVRNKLSKEPKRINKMIFNEEGNLMTVGQQHFKVWSFSNGAVVKVTANQSTMMEGRNVGLRKQLMEKEFVSVASQFGITCALTADGYLCMVNKEAIVFKHANIMLDSANCLQIVGKEALCGGRNSDIKVINLDTFQIVKLYPKPPPAKYENIQKNSQLIIDPRTAKFPRCIGLRVVQNMLLAIYDNKVMFVWQRYGNANITALKSFLGHRSEILCVSLLQEISQSITFFATSSSDQTIRIWHIYDECFVDIHNSVSIEQCVQIKRNAYCKNLTRIIDTEQLIYHIRCHDNKLLAFSRSCLYFYLLSDFSREQTLTLDYNIESVDLKANSLYVAATDCILRVYKIVNGGLQEQNVYRLKHPMENIVANQRCILCLGKGYLSLVSEQQNALLKESSGVDAICQKEPYCYWTAGTRLTIYNSNDNKTKLVDMRTVLEVRNAQLIRATSSYLVTVNRNDMPNVITLWDMDGRFLCEQTVGQAINDVLITEGGQAVIVGKSGTIIIWKFIYQEKVKKFKNMFKDRLKDSLSGSIWLEGSAVIKPEPSNRLIVEVPEVKQPPKSIRDKITQLEEEESVPTLPTDKFGDIKMKVIRKEIDVANYSSVPQKPQVYPIQNNFLSPRNRMNIDMNPSHVSTQVNQILQNVSQMQKKLGLPDLKIFESSSIEQIPAENPNPPQVSTPQRMAKIFSAEQCSSVKIGKQTSPKQSTINRQLEESMIIVFDEESILLNKFINFLESREDGVIDKHSMQLETIHRILEKKICKEEKARKKEEIAKINAEYMSRLQQCLDL